MVPEELLTASRRDVSIAARDVSIAAWDDALARHASGELDDGALACAYVAAGVRRACPGRWLQAPRTPALACRSTSAEARLFATRRLLRVPEPVAQALVGWASRERPAVLYRRVLGVREVLALQARGLRCVSLLDDTATTKPHADALAFAFHDLCHLEKFASEGAHEAQVGFFAALQRALDDPRWAALEGGFDAAWEVDRDYVLADMNGACVFLFVGLKSRLKLAVRRKLARARGAPVASGPLDHLEARAYADVLAGLYDLLAAPAASGLTFPYDAAEATSSRRDPAAAAIAIDAYFQALGREVLGDEAGRPRR